LEQLIEAEVPTMTIGNQETPLFAGPGFGHLTWALWNLILSVAGAVIAIMLGIRMLMQRRKNKEDDEQAETHHENEDDEKKAKRNRLLFVLMVPVTAIIAIVLFLLTQDMSLLMVMADLWTIAHVVLFVGGLLSYVFAFKNKKDEDEDKDEDNKQLAESNA